MGYQFECDVCWAVEPVDEWTVGTHAKNCTECGMDGCANCMIGDLCEVCYDKPVDNDEDDE